MSKLELHNIVKRFGDNTVCDGINLNVDQGQMVCLIGASGAGKSTLLKCINLLEPIEDGEIFLDGEDISLPGLNPQSVRSKIGMVFQSFNLFPHMTAFENAILAPKRIRNLPKTHLTSEVEMLFDEITSALDPQLVGEVLDVLLQLKNQGMTMLLATHEMQFARQAADKICFFKDGRILEEGSAHEIFNQPKNFETKAFLTRSLK